MNEINPYQSPEADVQAAARGIPPHATSGVGIWRHGKLLVMHKLAQLPQVCVKTNRPADTRVRKLLQWHHPALFLLIFAALLIYLIMALLTMKKATIEIPLTREWLRRRNLRLSAALGLVLAGAVLYAGGLYFRATSMLTGLAVVVVVGAGLLVGLVGLIACVILATILSPKKITDSHIYLKGVHPELLATFPPWPDG